MNGLDFIIRCTDLVYDAWHGEKVDVFVVWSCKTLQNNKAILATIVDNQSYLYEFSYNGDKQVIYMDSYSKKSSCRSFGCGVIMDIFDMSEAAYLNGYKKGFADAILGKMPIVDIEEDYFEEDEPPCTKIPS